MGWPVHGPLLVTLNQMIEDKTPAAEAAIRYTGDEEREFTLWMLAVDMYCVRQAATSVHDLADCTFREWYDDGTAPADAVRMALEAQGI